jgi:hypothetical protein
MNELIKQMVELAEKTSAQIGDDYTTVELKVLRTHGRTHITFQGYTAPGGHTLPCETLEACAAVILPDRCKLSAKVKALRAEAEEIEKLIGGAK